MKSKLILCLALVCLFRCAPVNAEEIFSAVRDGNVNTVSNLLVGNPKLIDSRNAAGMSLLQTALIQSVVENRNQQMIELLISKGADVDAQDDGGRTALHFSA